MRRESGRHAGHERRRGGEYVVIKSHHVHHVGSHVLLFIGLALVSFTSSTTLRTASRGSIVIGRWWCCSSLSLNFPLHVIAWASPSPLLDGTSSINVLEARFCIRRRALGSLSSSPPRFRLRDVVQKTYAWLCKTVCVGWTNRAQTHFTTSSPSCMPGSSSWLGSLGVRQTGLTAPSPFIFFQRWWWRLRKGLSTALQIARIRPPVRVALKTGSMCLWTLDLLVLLRTRRFLRRRMTQYIRRYNACDPTLSVTRCSLSKVHVLHVASLPVSSSSCIWTTCAPSSSSTLSLQCFCSQTDSLYTLVPWHCSSITKTPIIWMLSTSLKTMHSRSRIDCIHYTHGCLAHWPSISTPPPVVCEPNHRTSFAYELASFVTCHRVTVSLMSPWTSERLSGALERAVPQHVSLELPTLATILPWTTMGQCSATMIAPNFSTVMMVLQSHRCMRFEYYIFYASAVSPSWKDKTTLSLLHGSSAYLGHHHPLSFPWLSTNTSSNTETEGAGRARKCMSKWWLVSLWPSTNTSCAADLRETICLLSKPTPLKPSSAVFMAMCKTCKFTGLRPVFASPFLVRFQGFVSVPPNPTSVLSKMQSNQSCSQWSNENWQDSYAQDGPRTAETLQQQKVCLEAKDNIETFSCLKKNISQSTSSIRRKIDKSENGPNIAEPSSADDSWHASKQIGAVLDVWNPAPTKRHESSPKMFARLGNLQVWSGKRWCSWSDGFSFGELTSGSCARTGWVSGWDPDNHGLDNCALQKYESTSSLKRQDFVSPPHP